ncbi:hypothetical protein FB561_4100 [Kribbella amoyensis]|uniref:Uncharacterized protein n=2 Tax=Kribbella amoyensis TaxID=996641 RepID=A0A561BVN4_9ACTN|nr:hypothetical protein FB561_4100 [Kribbella amoyensis]
MKAPAKSTRAALAKAGNGGNWLIEVDHSVNQYKKYGWYRAGEVADVSTVAKSVELRAAQPKVVFDVCIDSAKTQIRFQKDDKPVPIGSRSNPRQRAQATLIFAPPLHQTTAMWFLIDEKSTGEC